MKSIFVYEGAESHLVNEGVSVISMNLVKIIQCIRLLLFSWIANTIASPGHLYLLTRPYKFGDVLMLSSIHEHQGSVRCLTYLRVVKVQTPRLLVRRMLKYALGVELQVSSELPRVCPTFLLNQRIDFNFFRMHGGKATSIKG